MYCRSEGNLKTNINVGVIGFPNEDYVLFNVIRTEEIKEPIEVMRKIIDKMNLDYLINVYKLDVGILKNKEISCENFYI